MEEGGIGLELIYSKGRGDPFYPVFLKAINAKSKLISTYSV